MLLLLFVEEEDAASMVNVSVFFSAGKIWVVLIGEDDDGTSFSLEWVEAWVVLIILSILKLGESSFPTLFIVDETVEFDDVSIRGSDWLLFISILRC